MAYAPAIPGGFIWDDNLLVPGNPLITSVDGFPAIWTSASSMDYIPLTISSFWLEWRLWDGNPIGYHLVNILLHAAGAFLLWRVLRKLSIPGAFLGAMLFAVHPVNAASVAWIAERKNTLSLVFYLLAVLWYLDFHAQRSSRYYTLALVAACCAFLSKGSTVILPAVLLGCVWWIEGSVRRRDWLACAPFAALAGIMALVTVRFQAGYILPESEHLSLSFRVIRAGDAVWFYLWKDLWPVNLSAIYPKWRIDVQSPPSYLPALLVVACVIGLWLQRRRWGRGPFFAASHFLLNLLPVLGFVNMGFMDQAYVADWWQQIALAAPAALAGAGISTLWSHASPKLAAHDKRSGGCYCSFAYHGDME